MPDDIAGMKNSSEGTLKFLIFVPTILNKLLLCSIGSDKLIKICDVQRINNKMVYTKVKLNRNI